MTTLWQIASIIVISGLILSVIGLTGYVGYRIGKFSEEWKVVREYIKSEM